MNKKAAFIICWILFAILIAVMLAIVIKTYGIRAIFQVPVIYPPRVLFGF